VGRSVAVAITAMLVLGGCTNDPPADGFEGLPDPSESPTPAADPSPTASAEAAGELDVTTTPDEITPEWVTAVVNTLLAEYGERTAEILAMPVSEDPTLPDGYEAQLDQLFDGKYLEFAKSEGAALLVDSDDRRSELLPPGQFSSLTFTTTLVQVTEPDCIVAVGRIDRSGTRRDGGESESLSAVSLTRGVEPTPTPWRIRDLLANTSSEGEVNPDSAMLAATLDDYGAALDHTCAGGGT